MSIMTKVFIVIQALLVMAYLGVSASLYQHRRDWRTGYQKLRERYALFARYSAQQIKLQEASATEKQKGIEARSKTIAQLKSQLDDVLSEYHTKSQDLTQSRIQEGRTQENNNKYRMSNDDLAEEIAKLDQRLGELNRDVEEAKTNRKVVELQVARLLAQKFDMESNLGELRREFVEARKDLRNAEVMIALTQEQGVDYTTLLDGPPVPLIRGAVVVVKGDVEPGLVLINIGAQDEVEVGFKFSVYREAEYVGRIIVEKVLTDNAACSIEFVSEGQAVQVGDRVTTRIP